MADKTATPPKAPHPLRGGLIAGLAVALVLGAIALDTTVVRIGSDGDLRLLAFDPDAYGVEHFPRIRDRVLERAPNAPLLAQDLASDKDTAVATWGTPAGIGPVMPVQLTGVVGDGRSGIFDVKVDGVPDDIRIRVQTGPAINGTELRDLPGDIEFGDFKNQIEYQDAGSGINRAMAAEALNGLDRDTLSGRTVTVAGVFKLINPKSWLVTPVQLEVQ